MKQIPAKKVALTSQIPGYIAEKFQKYFRVLSFVVLLLSFSPINQTVGASTSSVDEGDMGISSNVQVTVQDQPTVSVAVNPSSVNVGAAAVVTVSLNNVPTEGYTSIELTCTYDQNLVEPGNVVVAGLFGVDPVTAINGPHEGRIIVAIAGSDGNKATNSGTVIVFYVRGLQPGQMTLECKARASKGDNVLTDIESTAANLTILGSTPTPTLTPALCDKAQFVADINIPDGTIFSPGAAFTKTWRLKNVGSCVWTTSYRLVFFSGEQMNAPSSSHLTLNVLPRQTVDISVPMMAPSVAGIYRSYWMFQNASGALFGIGSQGNKPWWMEIRVSGPSATPGNPIKSPTPSITPGGPTLTPSFTSTPTIVPTTCDKAEFIADVSIPPGTVMAPGTHFIKTWRLKNVGTCTWTISYRIAFFSGEQMGALSSFQLPGNVAPGATVDISLNMTAPSVTGAYRGYWIFQNATGASFGIGSLGNEPWFVDIVVSNTTVTPGPTYTQSPAPFTPTATQTPAASTVTPIAGIAFDFVASMCAATWTGGAGQLPCPGIDGNANGFVFRVDNPKLETGATDIRPSLLTFPQNVQNGYIQGFYPPIHIQNGDRFRSILTCEFGATNCYVAFRLDYQVGADAIKTFWGPFLERYEGHYYSADIDLSPLAGKDVRFILTLLSAGIPSGDRALWVGPIIYRAGAGPTSTSEPPTATPGEPPIPTFTSTPSTSMFIRVTSPNGGEILNVGSTYRITWDSTPDIDKIFIGFKSCNSCLDWITFDIPNTGYYDWNVMVGNTVNTQFKIYIIGYDTGMPGSASDESDNNITVLQPAPTLPTIVPGFLTGRVLASKPITVSLYDTAHSLVTSVTANTDGTFNLTAPAGSYTVAATASGFLSAQGSAMISGGNTDMKITISLPAGDIDNNDIIDQFDALTIGMSYNTSVPATADLNNDGIINVLDLELLARNYRNTGPIVWQ